MICKQKLEVEIGFRGINREICHVFSHAVWLAFVKEVIAVLSLSLCMNCLK